MKKIFISAGHSNLPGKDRGAQSGSNIEGVLTCELRQLIADELSQLGVKAQLDNNSNALSETINFFRNLTSPDSIVLDIHFNAGPVKATGTETLVPAQASRFEVELAEALSKCVAAELSIPLRGSHQGKAGVKTELDSHHGRLGWMRLTGENVLMEICFISNPSEMEKYHLRKRELGKKIARVLFEKAGGVEEKHYIVKRGDSLWSIANLHGLTVGELQKLNGMTGDIITPGQRLLVKR